MNRSPTSRNTYKDSSTAPRHLLFSLDYPPMMGGVSSFLGQRIRNRDGIEISVLTVEADGWQSADLDAGVEMARFKPYFGDTRIVRRIFQFTQGLYHLSKKRITRPFDVLESGTALPGSFYGWVLKKFSFSPLRTVTFVHGNDFLVPQQFFISAWMLRKGLLASDIVIANSNFTAGLLSSYGIAEDRLLVINPPVDTERFRPGIPSGFVRERHGLGGRDVLMTVSRLCEGRKGFNDLFGALGALRRENKNLSLLVVGAGPARRRLESEVRERGLESAVVFTGFVSDQELPAYYCAADIFVMASEYIRDSGDVEGYGVVYDEAHACGKPCVAANAGGAPEAVLHEVDGLVVPPADARALAGAIETLLADRNLARRLGRSGRARLLSKEYAWDKLNKIGNI